jgi:uracil phosphoribosyltransferase
MTEDLQHIRPDCGEMLIKKNSWALNEEEFEINDEMKNIIYAKIRENELTIYSMLRSEINLIESESEHKTVENEKLTLKRSHSPEQEMKNHKKREEHNLKESFE